jgi:AcrR family transcriptional regulator
MTHMSDNLISPDDSRPTRSDAVKNCALLLETAQRLFQEHGVEAVSMTAIAEAAGVGKGTLYRHFKNKAALTHMLLDADTRDLQTRTLRRLEQGDDPLDNLRWFLEQVVRFVERNEELLCAAASAGVGNLLSFPGHLWWRQTIRGLLARMDFQPETDLDYLADVLYIMIDVRTIHFQKRTLGYDTTRILGGLHTTVAHLIS